MADYYPLIARALDSIREPDTEARQTVYGRARAALLTQLRSLEPPLAEAEIARERASLDEAIAQAEAAYAVRPDPQTAAPEDRHEPEADIERSAERAPAIRRGGRRSRSLITALALVAVIAPIAVAAWLYREVPAPTPAPSSAPAPGPAPSTLPNDLKFAERVSGEPPAPSSPPAVAPPAVVAPAAPVAAAPGPPSSPRSSAPALPVGQPAGTPSITAPTASRDPAQAAQAEIAVAHRALLAEANETDPQQPLITAGRVIWRTEMVNNGQGQLLETAVRAQIDVPEVGLSLLLTFQRNRDAALPASHTMELVFTSMRSGQPGRGVREVGVPQLRVDEATAGARVSGLWVAVKENVFLVGLSSLPVDVERNSELLLSRNWIEFPIRFASGQRAALLFEKGPSGERVLADAFRQWSTP